MQVFEQRAGTLAYAVKNGFIEVITNCLSTLTLKSCTLVTDELDMALAYFHLFVLKIAKLLVRYDLSTCLSVTGSPWSVVIGWSVVLL